MKILVAITSYGTGNDRYLSRVIGEYRSQKFDVDIFVLSNISKKLPIGAKLIVGLPTKNPWSLPFAHKEVFARELPNYDLFIYSEDDILITQKNIEAFLALTHVLRPNEVPGFLRFEVRPDGTKSYPDFHANFRWDPQSVKIRGHHKMAFFTNEHAGCYMLTRHQLQKAVESGGFLVPPHQGTYDLACSAATDVYTQCGFEKLVCVSELEDVLVRHLSDKYAEEYGLGEQDLDDYIKALLVCDRGIDRIAPFKTDSFGIGHLFSKNYYEPVRHDLVSLVPPAARSVISIGCGWGATEKHLAQTGRRVVVLPLDEAMSAWAQSKGLEIFSGDLPTAIDKWRDEPFDCLLISNLLHLADDPAILVRSLVAAMAANSTVIASMPNLPLLKVGWKRLHDRHRCAALGDFNKSGVHITSHKSVRQWFSGAGIEVLEIVDNIPGRLRKLNQLTIGLLGPLLASEIVVIGRLSHPPSRSLRKIAVGADAIR